MLGDSEFPGRKPPLPVSVHEVEWDSIRNRTLNPLDAETDSVGGCEAHSVALALGKGLEMGT